MDKYKIYLDLDDVLADFIGRACELHDPPILSWSGVAQDIPHNIKSMMGSYEFWYNLEPLPWIGELLTAIRDNQSITEARVLTSAGVANVGMGPFDKIKQAKEDWVEVHVRPLLGDKLGKTIVTASSKEKLYYLDNTDDGIKSSILVDDHPTTVAAWSLSGGIGICFTDISHALLAGCQLDQSASRYDIINLIKNFGGSNEMESIY